MTNEQLQHVVDAENERLNRIALAKATAELQGIAAINEQIARLNKSRAEAQGRIAALQFDSVTVADVIGTAAESQG